ncbi:MAG TPA: rhomboid family intramembrane serine protease [Mycobacteriales bacterium]|nr:rhomboid family intramembrane serine protease [Mycobacteriales bacterium]
MAAGNATVRRPRSPYGGRVARRVGTVTIGLAVLNVGAFLATAVTSPTGFTGNTASRLFGELDLVPIRVAVDGEYWRLLGAAFLHVGLLHLIMNMVALAVVGPGLERLFGTWRYLALYLLAALGGSVAVYLFGAPFGAVAGASGAIFGLFAATLIVLHRLGLDARSMLLVIGLNVAVSFAPSISLLGHLGGLVTGGLAALALVHAPKASRTPVQILALGMLAAILVTLVLVRSTALLALAR